MQIPGYTDLIPVGRGGFSTVYRAHQVALDRDVAVKVLSVDLVDEAARARFHRECATNGRVGTHPNVVTGYDSGFTDDGQPFLSMQWCPDGSLGDALRRKGPLSVEQVLHTGVSIASALAFAHSSGVLHRDLKPENILLSPFGEPLLADFGIAVVDDQRISTATASSFTINHAAPECLAGEPPSPSADVYGLASTLYTLLAGHPPFVAGSSAALAALLKMVLNDPAPPVDRGDVPESLNRLLLAGLAKEPGERPADAATFGRDLQQVQVELGLPITARLTARATSAAGPRSPGPAEPSAPTDPTHLPGSPASPAPPETATLREGATDHAAGTASALTAPAPESRTPEPVIAETLAPSLTTYGTPVPPAADPTMMGAHTSPPPKPAPSVRESAKTPRRHRAAAALIAAGVALALLIAGGTYYLLTRPVADKGAAPAAATTTTPGTAGGAPGTATGPSATPPTGPETPSAAAPMPTGPDTPSAAAPVGTTGAPPTNPAAELNDPCKLLPQSEAEELAATPLNPATAADIGDTRTCVYTGLASGPTAQVELWIGEDARTLLTADQTIGHEFTTLDGIGDEALTEPGYIFFRKADTWHVLHLIRTSDSPKYVKGLEDLARKIAARV